MQELFQPKSITHDLRKGNLLRLPSAKSSQFGTRSFLFRGCLLWNSLPDNLKSKQELSSFKDALKTLNLCEFCKCKICTKP